MMSNDEFPVDAETLSGDLRDALLTHVRSMETPWSKMSERDQQDKISAVSRMAENLVRGAVMAVANRGFEFVPVTVGKLSIDKAIKVELSAANIEENVVNLAGHSKLGAVLVLAESTSFMRARAPALPDPDQPELLEDEPNGLDEESDDENDDITADEPKGGDMPDLPESLDRREKATA